MLGISQQHGDVRQLLDIKRQLEDWKAAIAYARSLPDVDPQRVVIWGTSFGGGHVLATAAEDNGLAAVISQCPFTDGLSSSLAMDPLTSLKVTWLAVRDRLSALDDMATALGGPEVAAGWVANVRSMESLTAAMDAAAAHFGGIDTVIAGAGIGISGSLETMDPRDFDRVIDINLNGVWRTFRAALPHVKARRGYLLAISSMAAFIHSPLNVHYTASKAGVWALCNSARLELKQDGVGVGSFHPTFFQTPMMDGVIDGPCSTLVWNQHRGIWKVVPLAAVIDALVDTVAHRRQTVTVPRSNALVALAPGVARKLIEILGFSNARTAQAMQVQNRR